MSTSFSRLCDIILRGWTALFTCLSIDGHLGGFYLSAVVNPAAVNKYLFEPLFSAFWGISLGVQSWSHMAILV